jgi:hypothetical protein
VSPSWGARTRKPTARTAELLVEELGEELLIYDQRSDRVHCLSSAVCSVWRACDGETSVEQLASALNMESELVERALGELEGCDLLDADVAGLTRREATTRLARMGAAAAAAPLIYSIAAPTPALAVTACGTGRLGCLGFTSSKGALCPTSGGACKTNASCACCYTSPNQCSGQSWAACIDACGSCNSAYVVSKCPDAPCPSAKYGCQS